VGDKVAFVIPDTLEEALWTIPCISQYFENRLVTDRQVEQAWTFCPISEIRYLFESCWHGMQVMDVPPPEEVRNAVDLMFEFDPDDAYELTCSVGKHIVEAYGVLLGTVALSLLPPIVPPSRPDLGSVLVVGRHALDERQPDETWPYADEFVAMGQAFGISVSKLDMTLPFRELMREVSKASVVVGVRGSATLLAACFGRQVMELSPEAWAHKNWMGKWECGVYRIVSGDLKDMTPIFIWERTRTMAEEAGKEEAKRWEHRSHTRQAVGE
jgi:hypothetical protein